MNIAIILAGGVGSRVGLDRPKQFIEISNKPIIIYTLEKFQNDSNIDAIEVVCHNEWKEYLNKCIKKFLITKVKWICNGGNTFQESVKNGIYFLQNIVTEKDIVVIHFAASPFVSEEIIDNSIEVCKEKGNGISSTPFYLLSTFKDNTNEEKAGQWVDRETLMCMNSPHSFRYGLIKEIYDKAIENGDIKKVEPHTTSLMQYMGYPIYFSKGSQTNIKITTKEDLDLFEGYVLLAKKRKGVL